MKMKSQTELVLDYLNTFGSITSLEAFQKLGITRISARIYDLREEGHVIQSEFVKVPRRNGQTASVKQYSLLPKKQLGFEI